MLESPKCNVFVILETCRRHVLSGTFISKSSVLLFIVHMEHEDKNMNKT